MTGSRGTVTSLWVAALAVVVITGCSSVVGGNGQPATTPSQAGPSFPATTATTAPGTSAATSAATAPTTALPSTAAPTTTAASTPSRTQLTAQLAGLTPGRRNVVVAVPGSYEALTYDQAGHLAFWRHGSTWRRVGTSTFPYDATFNASPSAKADGALLRNMTHATFIVNGFFSGDGSGNAVAYTTGVKGWGAIKAEPNGNIGPSGQGVGYSAIGLADEFEFAHGLLMSADCSDSGPIADCGGSHRVIKFWRWAGHDFVLNSRAGLAH